MKARRCEQEIARLKKEEQERREQEEIERLEALIRAATKKRMLLGIAAALMILFFVTTKVFIPLYEYRTAVALLEEGKYEKAIDAFTRSGHFQDSSNKLSEARQGLAAQILGNLETLSAGDTIILGSYEQDNDLSNGKEAIEWIVLSRKSGKTLLISKYALDCKPYNIEDTYVTWENCSLRKWLNSNFYREAFSDGEAKLIIESKVNNYKHADGTNSGNDTEDMVFLLSPDEAGLFFISDKSRGAEATEYARSNGVYVNGSTHGSRWWLRTPGAASNLAAAVSSYGHVDTSACDVQSTFEAVRPALFIDLGY